MKPSRCGGSELFLIAGWLVLAVSGCATSPGGFTLFPAGNFLLHTTESLRDQTTPDPGLPRELTKMVLPNYVIQPGDVLLIEPDSLDSPIRFPADQTVMPDSTIELGRYGRRVVAGKTAEEIEAEVESLIRSGGDARTKINVRLVTARSAVYYVLGEVNSPGAFPLIGRETVLDGILAAGGISSRASNCNILLNRPTAPDSCRVVLPVCYRHITQMGDTSTNFQLMPGDRIYVATRTCCEQLAFWKSKDDCPMCCACQSACPGGNVPLLAVHYKAGPLPAVALPAGPTSAEPLQDETLPPSHPFLDEAARTRATGAASKVGYLVYPNGRQFPLQTSDKSAPAIKKRWSLRQPDYAADEAGGNP